MDIIIFSGQSNMQGQTEACPTDRTPVIGAYEYRFNTDEIIPLCHPVGETVGDALLWGAHEGHGSLIPDFCRAYRDTCGQDVLAVHAARGSTTAAEWQPETDRYAALVAKVRGALAHIPHPERIYFVWLQGESDAIYSVSQADYETKLRRLKAALLQDLPIDACAVIRVGKFVEDARDLAILRAQEALCAAGDFHMLTRITGVCTQNAAYLNPHVPGHYGNAGMTLIGRSAGENLGRIRLGDPVILEDEPYEDMKCPHSGSL